MYPKGLFKHLRRAWAGFSTHEWEMLLGSLLLCPSLELLGYSFPKEYTFSLLPSRHRLSAFLLVFGVGTGNLTSHQTLGSSCCLLTSAFPSNWGLWFWWLTEVLQPRLAASPWSPSLKTLRFHVTSLCKITSHPSIHGPCLHSVDPWTTWVWAIQIHSIHRFFFLISIQSALHIYG